MSSAPHSLAKPLSGAWRPPVHSWPFTSVPFIGVQGLSLSWAGRLWEARNQRVQKSGTDRTWACHCPCKVSRGFWGLLLLCEAWLLLTAPAAITTTSPDSPGPSCLAQGRPRQKLSLGWSTLGRLTLPWTSERREGTCAPGDQASISAPTLLSVTTPPAPLTVAVPWESVTVLCCRQ